MTDRTPTGDLRERLAEALAAKFTSPKRGKATEETGWEEPILNTPADRFDQGMGVVFVASDGINAIRSVTPSEAAVAVLPVVEDETAALRQRAEEAERQRAEALAERDDYATRLRMADAAYRELLGETDEQRRRAVEALAAVQRAREAADSARAALTTTSRDMSIDHTDAWLYGIFVGWDAEEPGEPESAMDEVAADHRWSADTVARLREHRRATAALEPPEGT